MNVILHFIAWVFMFVLLGSMQAEMPPASVARFDADCPFSQSSKKSPAPEHKTDYG